jgi:hypothetical protein
LISFMTYDIGCYIFSTMFYHMNGWGPSYLYGIVSCPWPSSPRSQAWPRETSATYHQRIRRWTGDEKSGVSMAMEVSKMIVYKGYSHTN